MNRLSLFLVCLIACGPEQSIEREAEQSALTQQVVNPFGNASTFAYIGADINENHWVKVVFRRASDNACDFRYVARDPVDIDVDVWFGLGDDHFYEVDTGATGNNYWVIGCSNRSNFTLASFSQQSHMLRARLFMGDGADTVKLAGLYATAEVNGGNGDDLIISYAPGGNITPRGDAGNDRIIVEPGWHGLGGPGHTLFGGWGADCLQSVATVDTTRNGEQDLDQCTPGFGTKTSCEFSRSSCW